MAEIEIDRDGPVAPYRQLANMLRERIRAGEIPPGERIPSEARLHTATGCARATIRRAVGVLVDEGLVTTVPYRGTYVRDQPDE
ncbi:GntR family transcriptional regulator [Actinoallomurus sp. CA-150999]|uniref:GntR family transcriptional regulator n=1 Tax=Actinoallomurus sp. CA-150999 TaxID=3239887 RepID=UPI003D8E7BA6